MFVLGHCVVSEYRSAVCEVLPELRERSVSVFLLCDNCDMDGIQSLQDKMENSDDGPVSHTLRANITTRSPAVYIFTSGTTGTQLPTDTHNHTQQHLNCVFVCLCRSP